MRLVLLSLVLCLTEAVGLAQSTEQQILQALKSLTGIWVSQATPERVPETMEFHWQQGEQKTWLVWRHWIGEAGGSPWKYTSDVMIAYYDPASRHIYADFIDRTQTEARYQLMWAGANTIQFVSRSKQGQPPYRLTYHLSQTNTLLVTMEQEQKDQQQPIVVVANRRFVRSHF